MTALIASIVALATVMAQPSPAPTPAPRARNVILFLGDAAGLPTVHAASVYRYDDPRRLFLHGMPHVALAETSSASRWVTDSAAGMTAIVTGHKTHNGVISQSDAAVRRVKDGEPLKTILEHAEERGLSTGVVTNSSVLSATPAACYAHVNDRGNEVEVLRQLLKPRFGDGVDVVIGDGLADVVEAATAAGLVARDALRAAGLELYPALDSIPADARRAAVLFDDDEFDLDAAVQRAIDVLSRNPKGFFLMVESNLHASDIGATLDRVVRTDQAIRRAAERTKPDTLVLFTADHSYDFRIHDGLKGQPLLAGTSPGYGEDQDSLRLVNVRRDGDHTAEDVVVAAQGPGAERVRGFLSNTDLFHIMMAAYGWK
ncbi:MAG TPA: alkaline phosphatase [Vicinamibacteria bacterium]|nr:alkaline phosphatase [Vicinamibacteria bacterium]